MSDDVDGSKGVRNFIPLSQIIMNRKRKGFPNCDTCGTAAEIVCVSPRWQAAGFERDISDDSPMAHFCCREHTERTAWWYWFWIIPVNERDDDCSTLHDWDFLIHLCEKDWGPSFVAWLLGTYQLASYHRIARKIRDGIDIERGEGEA